MRSSSFAIGTLVIAVLALCSGCSDQLAGMTQLNQNEFALRGMIASDRQQIDALKVELRRTQDQIDEMKHTGVGASGGSSNVDTRLAKLESEVNALQSTVPTPPAPSATSEAPPPNSISSTETTTNPSDVSAPPPTAGEAPAAGGGTEPAPTWPQDLDKEIAAAADSRDPGAKIYRKGLDAMKTGNYSAAIVEFAKIEHSYAKSPLSEPAQYFTANSFYESEKYEQSILQFNDLVMRFPNGRYTCQSLLREGQAFVRLNDKIDARLTLQKLTGDGSCTTESVVANNMLKSLATD